MTESPEIRIGNAERTEAESLLRQHMEAGRLSEGEFETRRESAREAWTPSDLNVLFADLPGPKPVAESWETPPATGSWEQPDFSHQQLVDPRVSDPTPARPSAPAPVPAPQRSTWDAPRIITASIGLVFAMTLMFMVYTGMFGFTWWMIFPMIFFVKYAVNGFGSDHRYRRHHRRD